MTEDIVKKYQGYQLYGNWLKDLNPLNKINVWLVIGVTTMVFKDWRFGAAAIAAYLLLAAYLGIFRSFIKMFSVCVVFLGVFMTVTRVFIHRNEGDSLFQVFGFSVTDAALENGLDMSAFLLGFSGALFLLFLTTPMRDIMLALEQKGWVKPSTSYIVLVSFKTITELTNNMRTILESQKARGIETEGNLWVRFKSAFPTISPMVLGAISYTEEKCISMESRAFANEKGHTYLRLFRPVPVWEKVFVAFVDVACVLGMAWAIYAKITGIM